MPIFDVEHQGRKFEVEAPDINSAMEALNSLPPATSTAADVAKSAGIGLAKGGIGLAGISGDVRELNAKAAEYAAEKFGIQLPEGAASRVLRHVPLMGGPSSQDIRSTIEDKTGKFYEPQTTTGKFAERVGEFAPAAVAGPGGVIRRVAMNVAAPALASEAAGQYADVNVPSLAPTARVAGALAGPLALGGAAALTAPVASRLAPEYFANLKIGQTLNRANMTPQEVAAELGTAGAEGQPMYAAADVLGHAGQRALSGTARQPHDDRQAVVDFLDTRQAGQGRRVANALAEGFAAPDTAAARRTALTNQRDTAADVNYAAARQDAGAVDVTPAIQRADQFLQPGITRLARPATEIADDSIEAAVRKARSYLTDNRSQISDFEGAFRAKKELDNMIERASSSMQRELVPIQKALDNQLARSSKAYANARDTFHQQSKAIEAVDTGAISAQRGRVEDTIPEFRGMRPDQQSAFRAGYADPLIAQTQGAAFGVNKARPLINDATAAEFPAFAAPGQAPRLQRRLARENRMFETRAAATGGSRTADNLADNADITALSPHAIVSLLSGNVGRAVDSSVGKLVAELGGQSPRVVSRVARALIETDPERFLAMAERARRTGGGAPYLARQLLTTDIASRPAQ